MTALPQRKSPRLKDYDYSRSGAYFVTICTYRRQHLFGTVVDQEMRLSRMGSLADTLWYTIPDHHPDIELDAFVVMPNHVHGIVVIVGTGRALSDDVLSSQSSRGGEEADDARVVPTARTLGTVVGAYKSAVTRRINQETELHASTVWQARYHDHIIRSERALNRIREYVLYNPARWPDDTFYSE